MKAALHITGKKWKHGRKEEITLIYSTFALRMTDEMEGSDMTVWVCVWDGRGSRGCQRRGKWRKITFLEEEEEEEEDLLIG